MGEASELMLDGTCCQECGEEMGEGDGYPRTCGGCRGNDKRGSFPEFEKIVSYLQVTGFSVRKLTSYHYRILKGGSKKKLDLFPKRQRYHDIKNDKRGRFELDDLKDRVIKFFNQ